MNDTPPAASDAPTKLDILRARARVLAREVEQAEVAEPCLEVIEFTLAYESYAVETAHVREVCPVHDLTRVPCTPPFVSGIVNLRGEILPVLDIKRVLEIADKGLVDRHHVLVLHSERGGVGLLVDAIRRVRTVRVSELQPAAPIVAGPRAAYVRGITADRLVILDLARLLTSEQLIVCEEVTV
jgi:purine-binding chemotaxis protein CheW